MLDRILEKNTPTCSLEISSMFLDLGWNQILMISVDLWNQNSGKREKTWINVEAILENAEKIYE